MSDVNFVIFIFISSDAESNSNVSSRYNNKPMNSTSYNNVHKIMQLDRSTENVLLKDSPPGQLTIVLLLDVTRPDNAAASPIMQAFTDVIYTYSRLVRHDAIVRFSNW